ncbi:MAG: sigma-70 family RNA polymerase sigma factor [Burkholderiales bacterium]|nr:sigma-70 family RNA polymerase sigma factor [Burkholderiales bacterium]
MSDAGRFESLVLPWLDAAYNLARWLLRDEAAAEDVVQDAALRALRHLGSLRGEARPWFLAIVRNACFDHVQARRGRREQGGWEDEALEALQWQSGQAGADAASALQGTRERVQIDAAIRSLAPALREVVVLREIEGLDYAEIAQVAGLPIGTVMSRLARARTRLRELLEQAGVRP